MRLTFLRGWSIIKTTRRCPLVTGTSPRWKPDGCHKHMGLFGRELRSQTVSRLLVTDGLLLFIVQVQHERHNAGNGAQRSKDRQQCRSHSILPPRDRFPARAAYTPPFRSRGMTGNRLLPHTVYKGGKNSTWTVGFHLCFIIQNSVGLSNKLGIKARRGKRRALRFSYP